MVDVESAQIALSELRHLSEDARATLECRIEDALDKMANVELCVLPTDEPVTIDKFLAAVEASCTDAAATLTRSLYLRNLYSVCIDNQKLSLLGRICEMIFMVASV